MIPIKTNRINLIGEKIGRWTILNIFQNDNKSIHDIIYVCECECGTIKNVYQNHLLSGNSQSCGCLRKELMKERMIKQNTYDLLKKYGIGYTSKGEEFFFDLEDYDKIKDYCWHINNHGYVVTYINRHPIQLHKYIIETPNGKVVDHIDGNPLNNQKDNLRICTQADNCKNRKTRIDNKSGYKGVCFNKNENKWEAYISSNKRRINLGKFTEIEDAIVARKKAEKIYFGEYIRNEVTMGNYSCKEFEKMYGEC